MGERLLFQSRCGLVVVAMSMIFPMTMPIVVSVLMLVLAVMIAVVVVVVLGAPLLAVEVLLPTLVTSPISVLSTAG